LTPEEFRAAAGVSRETVARLALYLDVLRRWQRRINLVAPATLLDPWRRHLLDSSQLAAVIPGQARNITDLGSGAGLPGLVLSIVRGLETHLVDADERKCAFLREAARIVGAHVEVHCGRIESLSPWASDVVTARAVAPLSILLDYSWPFFSLSSAPDRCCLFLKSRSFEQELTEAREIWNMRVDVRPSISDARGRVLCIRDLAPGVTSDGTERRGPDRG
jgi:16S rRNA (guanine527-N7)-methyltransferase